MSPDATTSASQRSVELRCIIHGLNTIIFTFSPVFTAGSKRVSQCQLQRDALLVNPHLLNKHKEVSEVRVALPRTWEIYQCTFVTSQRAHLRFISHFVKSKTAEEAKDGLSSALGSSSLWTFKI